MYCVKFFSSIFIATTIVCIIPNNVHKFYFFMLILLNLKHIDPLCILLNFLIASHIVLTTIVRKFTITRIISTA